MIKILLPLTVLILATQLFGKTPLKVIAIHSYSAGSWVSNSKEGLERTFEKSKYQAYIHHITYDYLALKTKKKRDARQVEILNLINNQPVDLIVIFDDEASDALMPHLQKSDIPVVLTGINNDLEKTVWYAQAKLNNKVDGVLERYPFEQSLKLIKKIVPNLTKISVLTSGNSSSKIIAGQFKAKFTKYNDQYSGIKLNKITISSSWANWKQTIKSSSSRDHALWILVPWNVNDSKGKEVSLQKIGDFYRANSKSPALGIVDINSQMGFLASFYVSPDDLASQAAHKGLSLLKAKENKASHRFEVVRTARLNINEERARQLGLKIPMKYLELGNVNNIIPMKYER